MAEETSVQETTTSSAQETAEQPTKTGLSQKDVDKIVGREKAEAKEAGATAKERELLQALGVQKVEEAQSALTAHREREEANRSEAEKAAKRAEKAEKQLETLQGYQERAERAETALTGYAHSLREGLPESLTTMLDRMDAVDQLEWLTEHRDEYVASDETTTQQPPRRGVDTTPRITPGENVRGRERLASVFGQKYGT